MLARRFGSCAASSAIPPRFGCLLGGIHHRSNDPSAPKKLIDGDDTSRQRRHASGSSSSSSTRWKSRQGRDQYTRSSKLKQLKSRAAFKLLEIDDKHRLFQPGQTVVDLGYAPGSWSQVAISRVRPEMTKGRGRVVGIDVIPAQPPRGVSTIQGDFLHAGVRQLVLDFVRDGDAGRLPETTAFARRERDGEETGDEKDGDERQTLNRDPDQTTQDEREGRVVDVVLSDMYVQRSLTLLSSYPLHSAHF